MSQALSDNDTKSAHISESELNDVAQFFDNHCQENVLESIKQRRVYDKTMWGLGGDHNDFETSCKRLKMGIIATKFNFSNAARQQVEIKLINNYKTIQYTKIGEIESNIFKRTFNR